jgi:hypothetical protein
MAPFEQRELVQSLVSDGKEHELWTDRLEQLYQEVAPQVSAGEPQLVSHFVHLFHRK